MNSMSIQDDLSTTVTISSNTTCPDATSPASDRVFGVTELLEDILLHTGTKDVASFRRINSTWQATIGSSPKLRQLIFLEPDPAKEAALVEVFKKHRPFFEHSGRRSTQIGYRGLRAAFLKDAEALLGVHPDLLFNASKWDTAKYFLASGGAKHQRIRINVDFTKLIKRKPGQWKNMLVSSPPSRMVEILGWDEIRHEEGVTLGMMCDEVAGVLNCNAMSYEDLDSVEVIIQEFTPKECDSIGG